VTNPVTYQYLKASGKYINADLPVTRLAYLLYYKAKPFGYSYKNNHIVEAVLPPAFLQAYQVLRTIIVYSIKKYIYKNNTTIRSPLYGHLAIKRERQNLAYTKVFNLDKSLVITAYQNIETHSFEDIIANLSDKAVKNLAPGILEINRPEKRYSEEFVNFEPRRGWNRCLEDIRLFIIRLYNSYQAKSTLLKDALSSFENIIPDQCFQDKALNRELQDLIDFVKHTKDQLLEYNQNSSIVYAFSHGDPSRNNILAGNKKILGIDWEYSRYRPVLYDLFFLLTIVRRNDFKHHSFKFYTEEICNSLLVFENNASRIMPGNSADFKINLLLFYLEYMAWKINVLDSIFRYDNKMVHQLIDHIGYLKECEPYLINAFNKHRERRLT